MRDFNFSGRSAATVVLVFGFFLFPVLAFAQATGASLSVLKIGSPNPVQAGSNLTYTITVSNEGPDDAADVALSDTLPTGTTFASLASPGGWSCTTPAVGSGGTVSCTNALLQVGSAVFTLTVQVDSGVSAGTILSNTAAVTSTTPDPNPGDESATAMTTVGAASGGLSLAIADSPDPVAVGSDLTYAITLTSTLTDAADGTLTLPLPTGTTFQSFSGAAGWSCSTPAVGSAGSVVCTNPAPPAPGVELFALVVQVGPTYAFGDTVDAMASLVLSTGGRDVVATAAATTSILSPASVSATKSVTGAFAPGGSAIYTIVLANAGPGVQSDNPGAEFTDVLPAQLVLGSASASAGTATANLGTNTVTWDGTIPANGTVTITINASVSPAVASGTTISNQGSVSFDADGNGTNETSGQTDDPGLAGPADPTGFIVSAVVAVPALSATGLSVLAFILAAAGIAVSRRKSRT